MSSEHPIPREERPAPRDPRGPQRYFYAGSDSDSESSESDFDHSPDLREPLGEAPRDRERRLRETRRANARAITSNVIPDMESPEEMPYCIWYPGLATENAYRDLARRYPELRYQVGRACAVGGYLTLYLELDLLPDVCIAEEAREAGNDGSTAIFEHIMKQPCRYAVMNDYERTVNLTDPRAGACLNGDTAISPPPDKRDGDGDDHWIWPNYFDITEQWIDQNNCPLDRSYNRSRTADTSLPRAFTYLLHSPLPADLPTVRKDALIVMAAYEGNVDRYDRLKRRRMVHEEPQAVLRGIYHSTSFAKYYDTHPTPPHPDSCLVGTAILARYIMINDLSDIPEHPEEEWSDVRDFPRVIWYPLFPREETLRELLRRRPNNNDIRQTVALACIAANYQGTYAALAPVLRPSMQLWQQALKSSNTYYARDLRQRVTSGVWPDLDPDDFPERYCDWYPHLAKVMEPTTTTLQPMNLPWGIVDGMSPGPEMYWGWETAANAAPWELYMCSPDELRDELEKDPNDPTLELYAEWKYDTKTWKKTLPWTEKEGSEKGGEVDEEKRREREKETGQDKEKEGGKERGVEEERKEAKEGGEEKGKDAISA